MREATKTRLLRGPEYIDKYFRGSVLDIGCGPDLIVSHAQPFDKEHGDANLIASYLPAESFDCVHSSHCLEHMRDARAAIEQWWSLVKPGGFLVVAVPEENLYEQGVWPPMFNPDHKATFRWDTPTTWSPVSWDLRQLVLSLPDAEIVEGGIQDAGYDYRLRSTGGGPLRKVLRRAELFRKRVFNRLGLRSSSVKRAFSRVEFHLGCPIDQTEGDAMAQIQVIARKRPPSSR
jgi:SAM-dependent methyltransferase